MLYLKEHRQVALHVACGDITDISLSDGKFTIKMLEKMIASLLEEGRREIERALRWQGLDVELVINLKEQPYSKAEQDIQKLKEVFGDVKIIHNKFNWR